MEAIKVIMGAQSNLTFTRCWLAISSREFNFIDFLMEFASDSHHFFSECWARFMNDRIIDLYDKFL